MNRRYFIFYLLSLPLILNTKIKNNRKKISYAIRQIGISKEDVCKFSIIPQLQKIRGLNINHIIYDDYQA